MHEVFNHLGKRVDVALLELEKVTREVELQLGRENKLLEQVEYGDEFDSEASQIQEQVVAALQEVIEQLCEAEDRLGSAKQTLREVAEG